MSIQILILLVGFTTIIVSFIWARIWLFESNTDSSKLTLLTYDSIVGVHIASSYYGLTNVNSVSIARFSATLGCLTLGGILFAWTASTNNKKKLVFNDDVDQLITDGAYSLVRHPFYLSYTLTWCATSIPSDLMLPKITLVYLIVFYIFSARREEKALLSSTYSLEYGKYRNEVGMFFPRIIRWIN